MTSSVGNLDVSALKIDYSQKICDHLDSITGAVFVSATFFGCAVTCLVISQSREDSCHRILRRELDRLKEVRFPKILLLIGVCRDVGGAFVVVSEETGTSLANRLDEEKKGQVGWNTRVSVCKQVASALSYLHFKGIVFRSLNMNTVRVFERWLIKLESMALIQSALVKPGEKILKDAHDSQFMAPEVLMEERRGFTSSVDVFSFGILVLELAAESQNFNLPKRTSIGSFRLNVENIVTKMGDRCPAGFLDMGFRCCADDPRGRPDFRTIIGYLEDIDLSVTDNGGTSQGHGGIVDFREDHAVEELKEKHSKEVNELKEGYEKRIKGLTEALTTCLNDTSFIDGLGRNKEKKEVDEVGEEGGELGGSPRLPSCDESEAECSCSDENESGVSCGEEDEKGDEDSDFPSLSGVPKDIMESLMGEEGGEDGGIPAFLTLNQAEQDFIKSLKKQRKSAESHETLAVYYQNKGLDYEAQRHSSEAKLLAEKERLGEVLQSKKRGKRKKKEADREKEKRKHGHKHRHHRHRSDGKTPENSKKKEESKEGRKRRHSKSHKKSN